MAILSIPDQIPVWSLEYPPPLRKQLETDSVLRERRSCHITCPDCSKWLFNASGTPIITISGSAVVTANRLPLYWGELNHSAGTLNIAGYYRELTGGDGVYNGSGSAIMNLTGVLRTTDCCCRNLRKIMAGCEKGMFQLEKPDSNWKYYYYCNSFKPSLILSWSVDFPSPVLDRSLF